MNSRPSLLSVKNLTVAYGKNTVIKSANFVIEKQDFFCVVGANGSGKSTLIKTLLGLIQPVSGKIIYEKSLKKTAIGYLPQETKVNQNFPATVFEIVLSGVLGRLGAKSFYRKSDKDCAESALKTLKIENLKNECFSSLSGGQKQKVLLARALAATSELLILDEPSNSLDYRSREEFYKILKRLNTKKKLTIIMITHDLDADDLIGDKILAIKNGHVESETTKDYLRSFR